MKARRLAQALAPAPRCSSFVPISARCPSDRQPRLPAATRGLFVFQRYPTRSPAMDDMKLFVPITNTSISAARRCGWTKPLERSSAAGQIAYLEFQFGLFGKGAY